MGFLDRAGNLVKGFLKKPLEALEKSPEEKMLERELADKAALERARTNIEEMDRQAGPAGEKAKPKPAEPKAEPAAPKDGESRPKRRMGPD